jgi:hypothetical protein
MNRLPLSMQTIVIHALTFIRWVKDANMDQIYASPCAQKSSIANHS